MLPDDAKIISVDDHVIEHPRVWLDRVPAKYAEVAPRIVKLPDGNDTWLYEGSQSGNFALNAVAGKHPRDFGMDPRSYDDMLPGCHDIADRIKDMDIEGTWAQLCFPNFGGFAGSTFYAAEDKDFAKLCISAYNDFILDEWCAYAPQRQIPLIMVPFWDIDASVAEDRTDRRQGREVGFVHRGAAQTRSAVVPYRSLGSDPARLRGSRTPAVDALRLRWHAAGARAGRRYVHQDLSVRPEFDGRHRGSALLAGVLQVPQSEGGAVGGRRGVDAVSAGADRLLIGWEKHRW